MHVVDLKYGRGHQVAAEGNLQLALYALGCLQEYSALADISEITMTIHQPRAGGVSSWTVTRAELERIAEKTLKPAVRAVAKARKAKEVRKHLKPSTAGCQWCRAKATCPALIDKVQFETAMDFEDLDVMPDVRKFQADALAQAMAATDLVEAWVRAVRTEVERRLHAGEDVTGWKLVEGRRGARKWTDETAAEEHLFAALQHAAYEKKLLTPAAAEKFLKKHEAWPVLAALTQQSAGSPTVAPADDKRPTWSPAQQFDNLTTEGTL
jgi:hypothetical protein